MRDENILIIGADGEGKDEVAKILIDCYKYIPYMVVKDEAVDLSTTQQEANYRGKIIYMGCKKESDFKNYFSGRVMILYVGRTELEGMPDEFIQTSEDMTTKQYAKAICTQLDKYITIYSWVDVVKGRVQ